MLHSPLYTMPGLMADRLAMLDSEDQLLEVFQRSRESTKYFCEFFLRDTYFFRNFSKLHDQIFEVIDDEAEQKVAIAAPRDMGKSTLVNMAFGAKRILLEMSKYIVIISCTSGFAEEHSDNTRKLITTDDMITSVDGWDALKPVDRTDRFGRKEWMTSTGITVKPRGAGQQIRGSVKEGQRPDLFLIDDLEDDEAVESDERREKLAKWFWSALMNSVDIAEDADWRIIMIGTILHEASLLNSLMNSSGWTSLRLSLCTHQFVSNWPEFMSTEHIRGVKKEMDDNGRTEEFYREFMNEPIDRENQAITADMFKDYRPRFTEADLDKDRNVRTMIVFDPARSLAKGSANTAILGVSVNVLTGAIFIRDAIVKKMDPLTLYTETLDMAEQLKAIVIGIETTGLGPFILHPFVNEMRHRGRDYAIVEVKPSTPKTHPNRSGGLVPLYRKGVIWHNRDVTGSLELRLMNWPRPDKWDEIDAFASHIFVMSKGDMYFIPEGYDPMNQEPDMEYYAEVGYDPQWAGDGSRNLIEHT